MIDETSQQSQKAIFDLLLSRKRVRHVTLRKMVKNMTIKFQI